VLLSISAQGCKLATDFSFPCHFCRRCSSEAQRSLCSSFSIFGLFDLVFLACVFRNRARCRSSGICCPAAAEAAPDPTVKFRRSPTCLLPGSLEVSSIRCWDPRFRRPVSRAREFWFCPGRSCFLLVEGAAWHRSKFVFLSSVAQPGCDSARSDFGFQQYRCWLLGSRFRARLLFPLSSFPARQLRAPVQYRCWVLGFRFRARLLFPLSSFPARQLRAPVHSAARALASAKTFILASNFVPARLVSRSDLLSGAVSFGPKACCRFSSAAGVDFSPADQASSLLR
jgi:hypothetical protein